MEIFGDQKLQPRTKWRSEFNTHLKTDEEKSKHEAKKQRAFLKSRKLRRAEEKKK